MQWYDTRGTCEYTQRCVGGVGGILDMNVVPQDTCVPVVDGNAHQQQVYPYSQRATNSERA